MLKFYYSGAPNPTKVALFLEETGLPYEAIPVDTRKGEQHKPEFLAINPNAKLPAIVDGDVTVFDSSAILLYLAEKTGKFLPAKTDKARGELLSWMFFVSSGVGPYFGQSVHFRNYAPEKIPYAVNRYTFEAQRHAGILDARLAKHKYMLGDTYTIVDMNVWGWSRMLPNVVGDGAWDKYKNLEETCRRDQRPSRRAKGLGLEGPPQVQDRDGRRSAQRDVPASGAKGRVVTASEKTANKNGAALRPRRSHLECRSCYWNSFIALTSVCNTPSVSGMPTKPQASTSCSVVVPFC